MLTIKRIMQFFGCSRTTAWRKMCFYKDVFGTSKISIFSFLGYELENGDDIKKWLKQFNIK